MHVIDKDLELYLLGRLPPDQLSAVEFHLSECSSCSGRLSDLAGLAFRLLKLSNRFTKDYAGIEKRREHRIPSDDPGQMQTFSPYSQEKILVRVADVSRNGLKVRSPQSVGRGMIVQVHVREAIILGEVRYCIESRGEFEAGIQIQDVVPKHRA
jgi:hypothetical protein